MSQLKFFKRGESYRDAERYKSNPDSQFGHGFYSNGNTIENTGGIRRRYFQSDSKEFICQFYGNEIRIPSVLVLITADDKLKISWDKPWKDINNPPYLYYYGDNKTSVSPFKKKGCRDLILVNAISNLDNQKLLPPILHFTKRKSGWMDFEGVYKLENLDFYNFEHDSKTVRNVHTRLRLISDKVDMDWIRARPLAKNLEELAKIDSNAQNFK